MGQREVEANRNEEREMEEGYLGRGRTEKRGMKTNSQSAEQVLPPPPVTGDPSHSHNDMRNKSPPIYRFSSTAEQKRPC